MPKKTKFKLQNLRVKSFVTSLNDDEKNGVKGGNLLKITLLTPRTIFSELYDCDGETNICTNPPVTFIGCPTSPGMDVCLSAYSPIRCDI